MLVDSLPRVLQAVCGEGVDGDRGLLQFLQLRLVIGYLPIAKRSPMGPIGEDHGIVSRRNVPGQADRAVVDALPLQGGKLVSIP